MLVGSWLAFDKTISILAGNLNSGGSYLITAVPKKRKLLPCVNHRIVLCNLFFDHTNYISLGNYCFIVWEKLYGSFQQNSKIGVFFISQV